jgi:hypothetical protein
VGVTPWIGLSNGVGDGVAADVGAASGGADMVIGDDGAEAGPRQRAAVGTTV